MGAKIGLRGPQDDNEPFGGDGKSKKPFEARKKSAAKKNAPDQLRGVLNVAPAF
jgi:hypothetical protein